MLDDPHSIDDALAQLHSAGWSIGETAFYEVDRRTIVHVVIGSNGENRIWAEGGTAADVWHEALGQAKAVGMLTGWPRPAPE
jgi:hypothetical protein